jgi:hypothetical protein
MNQRQVIIVVVVVVVLVCLCGALFLAVFGGSLAVIFGLTAPVTDGGNAFMQDLKDGNYEAAFTLCTPELQAKLGGADQLRTKIEDNGLRPEKWSFNSQSINGSQGKVGGSVTFAGSHRQGSIEINLVKRGEQWLVDDFLLKP